MAPRTTGSAPDQSGPPGRGRLLVPSDRQRAALVKRLSAATAPMATAVLAAMDAQHPWYRALDAEARSWIGVVARTGIEGFVQWVEDDPQQPMEPTGVFSQAPLALTRVISLQQTVELVRTTIAVVEEQIQHRVPRGDRAVLQTAILHFSREVAFAAAEVYARAAEQRGAWDARMEALVVDGVVRGEADEAMLSRASTLGWKHEGRVFVAAGPLPRDPDEAMARMRHQAGKLGGQLLVAVQGERMVAVVAGELEDGRASVRLAEGLEANFGEGHVVVGPLVDDLVKAHESARAAISGLRASAAWPEGGRVLPSSELLPERALAGDGHARRMLSQQVFGSLAQAGGDLLETCVALQDNGGSVEATARQLFVHANTVRYRIKRIQDVTGYSPSDARDAYVLRLAITLGRLAPARGERTDQARTQRTE